MLTALQLNCKYEGHYSKILKAALGAAFSYLWEHTGSNRGPSACKADALNQLSYAPLFWDGKDMCRCQTAKLFFQRNF